MVEGMDHTDLTENFFSEKVITPVVLGMFANDEWDSIAMDRDPDDERILTARIVVSGEAIEVLLDYPDNTESLFEMQQRLIEEFAAFIEASEFGARRTPEWTPDDYNDAQRPAGVIRTPRPAFTGPSDCTLRRRRIGMRSIRFDRRRCVSAHRRS